MVAAYYFGFLLTIGYIFSLTNGQMVHVGKCPEQRNLGPCGQGCVDDGACDQFSKCCDTGCGRTCKRVGGNLAGGPFAAVQRPPPTGQRQQSQFGNGPIGQGNAGSGGGRGLPLQQQFLLQQQQQQQQQQIQGQPSLVNVGGCNRGVSLRNADGSTLVCGFGPRDFACPSGFACTFDNSLRALVCCPAENATRSSTTSGSSAATSNPCPEGEPIKDEFGNRLQCNSAGGSNNVCPTGTLCVVGTCCPVSVAGLISVKPGQCPPPLPVSQGSSCQNDCTFDADCPGPAKCCFVGCGARCVASSGGGGANGPPGLNGQAGLNGGGPLTGNGASISNFNLVPTRNDGIFVQQQQQRPQQGSNNFLSPQQQQFQFPNNGPPGSFGGGGAGQLRGPPGSNGAGQQRSFGNNGPPQFSPNNNRQQLNQFNANNRQFDQVAAE